MAVAPVSAKKKLLRGRGPLGKETFKTADQGENRRFLGRSRLQRMTINRKSNFKFEFYVGLQAKSKHVVHEVTNIRLV